MAESEVNVINHLLDVEHQASEMISGAQGEADKRISSFRAQAETEYKKQYDDIIAGFEAGYKKHTEEIDSKHKKTVEQYKSDIQNTAQNKEAFGKLLDTILAVD
jgi:vacuolar-type H+-ATPase subunit H